MTENREQDTKQLGLLARRKFLVKAGLLGVAAGASTLTVVDIADTAANQSVVSDTKRWGLLIDSEKCASGCDACVRGCNEEHALEVTDREEIDAQWIRKIDLEDRQTGQLSSLPMMCQHCDSAPCVDVCPTGASFKRDDGIVLVNKHTCIGCRYCMMACPFKARSFIHEEIVNQKSWAPRGKGTVESCTLCVHRIDAANEQNPACADACRKDGYDAIVFGDLNDANSEIAMRLREQVSVTVRPDLELNAGVRYTRI